jgi:hypothetical protein
MKILIAYDGSEDSDIAIDGLQRAGLLQKPRHRLSLSRRSGSRLQTRFLRMFSPRMFR